MQLAAFVAAPTPHPTAWPDALTAPIVVVRGPTPGARDDAAMQVLARLAAEAPDAEIVTLTACVSWPFERACGLPSAWPPGRAAVAWAPDCHEAFENMQTNSTRLVTTQPLFVLQAWLDVLRPVPGHRLVTTADADSLRQHAPEALAGRGAWRHVQWVDAPADGRPGGARRARPPLAEAFRLADPAARLTTAGRALDAERTPAHLLAMASVCMEVNDLDNAGALLSEAVAAAPDWAAAHFEQGKYWLRRDDMAAASEAFGAASRLMPGFASAAANWGATLGELDRPEAALAAFERALATDPDNPQGHNNVGVVLRELGRLAESEAAFRTVIGLTPDLAFGHYNLGHTLFLQGRYQASLAAYEAGQRNDPARNPVQASRLALARLATGDAPGAVRDLQGCTANLPRDYRRQLLADTQSVAWALLSAAPDLRDWRLVGDWLAAELAKA